MDTPFLKHFFSIILLWITPVVFLIGIGFFFFGFRLTKTLHILSPGTLTIVIPHADTNIYLDKKFIGKSSKEGDTLTRTHIAPGPHTLGVEKQGYWPWYKEIVIKDKETLTLHPFTVNKNPSGSIITEADPEYFKIDAMIAEHTKADRVNNTSTNQTLIKDGSRLYEHDTNTSPIFEAKNPIRSIAYFPDYTDVALVAVDTGIYAIELTREGTPNFQPLYKGLSPTFVTTPNHTLLIKDLGTLMELSW
jgi:hypothetical protein